MAPPVQIGGSLKPVVLGLAVALALIAGWTDLRSRRIPNWLTIPGLVVGIVVNVLAGGLAGLKTSLLGAGLGLRGRANVLGPGDLQAAIQADVAQHWTAAGIDVHSSYAGNGSFAG